MNAVPEYVDDGRPCQIVTVAELLPGDELLGWQGEPWTLGTVESVERVARPTMSGGVRYSYLIHMVDQPGHAYVDGSNYRRIMTRRSPATEVPVCAAHAPAGGDWTARCTCPAFRCPPEEAGR